MTGASASRGGRRRLAAIGAVLFGGYAVYILTATVRGRGLDLVSGSLLAFTAAAAVYCGWFALRAGDPRSRPRLRAGCLGGAVLGGAGFLAGLVAPLLWTTDGVPGPLLGLLVTGPLGFVLGLAGGVAVRVGRERRSRGRVAAGGPAKDRGATGTAGAAGTAEDAAGGGADGERVTQAERKGP